MSAPSYSTMHRRLRALHGPATAQRCAECGGAARFWTYTGTDPDELRDPVTGQRYSVDPGRYRPRCASCHRTMVAGHRPVAAEALDGAVALYETGASLAAIAAHFHVTRPVVRAALAAHGAAIRPSRSASPQHVDGDRIAALYAAGASLHALAGQLRLDRSTVRAALIARGVPIRQRTAALDVGRAVELYTSGASLARVAQACGVGRYAVRSALTTRGVPIRPARSVSPGCDGERAATLYAAGASLRGIAALLGANRPSVRAAVVAAGVPIRPPGPTSRAALRRRDPSPGSQQPPATPPRVIFRPTRTTGRHTPTTDYSPIRP